MRDKARSQSQWINGKQKTEPHFECERTFTTPVIMVKLAVGVTAIGSVLPSESLMLNDERVPLPTGTFIEGFEILEYVARGGLSLVYRAKHPDGDEVIVKEFCPLGSRRAPDGLTVALSSKVDEDRKDFSREAHNLNALKQLRMDQAPWRAPRLFSQCDENGTLYLVLERIPGICIGPNSMRMQRRGRPAHARWMKEVFEILAEGLEAFAVAGIAHGDISPDNIIIADDDGRPTFIDFGSAYHRKDYRTALGPANPSYRPPREVTAAIVGGAWLDVHGLCATFHFLIARKPPFEGGAVPPRLFVSERLTKAPEDQWLNPVLDAIDRGMVVNAAQPILSAAGLRQLLGADPSSPTDTGHALAASVSHETTIIRRKAEMAGTSNSRHQYCLLQSFDTPRFRTDDGEWLKRTDGEPLVTSLEQKVALARAEALLAICFGREIVVPAGQVADSVGFETVFNEVYAAYAPRQHRIRAACARVRLPEWRPFRLGLERLDLRDYVGFTRSYRYTGADMVLLKINNENVKKEEGTAAFFAKAVKLFGEADFSALGQLMEREAGRPNFEPFARDIHAYFDPTASVFADPLVPEVSTGEYATLFRARLEDARLSGRGLVLAREALKIVDEIESDLTQHGLQGFRGNWYVYRKKFVDTWPLARGYLDFRLFMNLARIYDVDHPILVSQAFEYGVFDHSLFLGPKFKASEDQSPDREVDLLKLAACTTAGVNWDEVLEMFLDDEFLRSVRLMNRAFFSDDPDDAADYPHLLRAHAGLLERKAQAFLRVNADLGLVGSKSDSTAKEVMIDAVDSVTHPDAFSAGAQSSLESVNFGTDMPQQGGAFVAVAPIDTTGNFNLGQKLADQMLNYYIKPYRMLMNRKA